MSFNDSAFLLASQFVKNRSQEFADLPEHHLASIFGREHNVILAVPLGMGKALIQFGHTTLSYGFASPSHRGSYFTPATLKAGRVALVKPVAYL
jgi:hypothetical protein